MDGIIDPGRGVCIGGTRALAARSAQIKTKTRPENAEEAEEAEVSWGCVAESAVISKAQEKIDRSTQPPRNLCFLRFLCVSRFCFWFICANPAANGLARLHLFTQNCTPFFDMPETIVHRI